MKQTVFIIAGIVLWLAVLAGGTFTAVTLFDIDLNLDRFVVSLPWSENISCPEEEVAAYLQEIDLRLEEWQDTEDRAKATSRISLSPVISDMQRARRELRRLSVPQCGEYLNDLAFISTDLSITAYLAFQSDQYEEDVAFQILLAEEAWQETYKALRQFQANPRTAYSEVLLPIEGHTKPTSFTLPENWTDTQADNSSVAFSVPSGWTASIEDDADNPYYILNPSDTDTTDLQIGLFPLSETDSSLNEFGWSLADLKTDGGRKYAIEMFARQMAGAQVTTNTTYGFYGQNIGYLVKVTDPEAEYDYESMFGIAVTPAERLILFTMIHPFSKLSEADLELLPQIISSIRDTNQ